MTKQRIESIARLLGPSSRLSKCRIHGGSIATPLAALRAALGKVSRCRPYTRGDVSHRRLLVANRPSDDKDAKVREALDCLSENKLVGAYRSLNLGLRRRLVDPFPWSHLSPSTDAW